MEVGDKVEFIVAEEVLDPPTGTLGIVSEVGCLGGDSSWVVVDFEDWSEGWGMGLRQWYVQPHQLKVLG
jgi:hypothetical protein